MKKSILKEFIEVTIIDILSEVNPRRATPVVTGLAKKYPKSMAVVANGDPNSEVSLDAVNRAKAPMFHLEKAIVYHVNDQETGLSLSFARIGRKLEAIRKELFKRGFKNDSNILQAFEEDESALVDTMDELGWFGSASDELRDPADQVY